MAVNLEDMADNLKRHVSQLQNIIELVNVPAMDRWTPMFLSIRRQTIACVSVQRNVILFGMYR